MIKKILILFLATLVFVITSVVYNYLVAQKAIRETKTSVLFTDLTSYPETLVSGNKGTFFWTVQTPNDLDTSYTTIYWSYESTPSALTVYDEPSSVGYNNHTTDYLTGKFKLPDTFNSQIQFDLPGKVYYRSYAKVRDQNLWSKEYTLIVEPNINVKK